MKRKLMIIMTMVLFLITGCGRLDAESEAKKFKEYDLKEEDGFYRFQPYLTVNAILSSFKNDPNTFDKEIKEANIPSEKNGVVLWFNKETGKDNIEHAIDNIKEKNETMMPDWVKKEILKEKPDKYYNEELNVDGILYPYHLEKRNGELLVVFRDSFKYYVYE
ncbi:hypothetical protein SRCM101294_02691 [Bacillus amyloliquefaciens]|uniref:hypothetical protein n=1 Tax=Bacillus amyloliquefaciens TaxID=1390 RepID=UPI00080C4ACA|nr:hypothetical protein [Bacillus amyloliquefaciens]OCB94415.1 hypothetical protein SRCM101294_02691 [Bacillus amyloliquefaciens]